MLNFQRAGNGFNVLLQSGRQLFGLCWWLRLLGSILCDAA